MADLRRGHPAPPKIVKIKLNHSTPSGNHIPARQRLLMGLLQTSLKIVMKLLLLFKYNHEKKYHRSLSLIYSFNLFSLIHFCLSKSLKIKELPGVPPPPGFTLDQMGASMWPPYSLPTTSALSHFNPVCTQEFIRI